MDKSWRDKAGKDNVMDDPALSRWEKFTAGGYSFHNVGRRFAKKLAYQQRKMEFLDRLIEDKYEDERDRIVVKRVELKILSTFNMYRVPFMAGSFLVCMLSLFRSKRPLYVRMMPLIFLGSFTSLYNYHIG